MSPSWCRAPGADTAQARWLLVGALPGETLPILRRLVSARWRSPRLIEGALPVAGGAALVAVLTCGPGPTRASRRTRETLRRGNFDRVISLGTCGALRDGLAVGDLLCGSVATDEAGQIWPLTPLAGLPALPIVTVRAVVGDPAGRAALARAGHAVCEMEVAAIAAAAEGRPVAALKVVSDLAGADPAEHVAPLLPTPRHMLRFHGRALALSERRLLPALRVALAATTKY